MSTGTAATGPSIPPGPPTRLPGGHALDMLRVGPLQFLLEAARAYGDVVGLRLWRQPVVMLSHPDMIRDVLVTHHRDFRKWRGVQPPQPVLGNGLVVSEGSFHRRQRQLIQPVLQRQRIPAYTGVMVAHAERERDRWRDGQVLDVHEAMMGLTLGIVAEALFGADTERQVTAAVESALRVIMAEFRRRMLPINKVLERLPLPATRRFRHAIARLDAIVYRMIEERRTRGVDRGDLLSTLLLAEEAGGDGAAGRGAMTDSQLRDEVMTLLLAGHETTGNALTWTLYLVSRHPDAERRLHAEVDAVLAGRTASFQDLPDLPFTRQIVAESMRVYPPVWTIGRRAPGDYEVAGYTVPAGALVLMSQYVVHHDARWYPRPDRFDPDRWTAEREQARPRFAYFPFGGGARGCIGESFAWTEAVLVLATLASRWRFHPVPGHPVVPQTSITLRPRHGMPMRLERR
jgi:cytochrome P450